MASDNYKLLSTQIKQVKIDLDISLNNKELSEPEYNKNIVELAYEYVLNGFPDDCLLMLVNLKSDYFATQAIIDFDEDHLFLRKCSFIFEVLAYVGHVPFEALCTQPVGKA